MPHKLERFPSPATALYPWDELLDGNTWELVAGEDFTSKPSTVVANARAQAKRRGGTLRTRSPDEAAWSLGVSRDYFDLHVLPELRVVRRGRRRIVPVRELERWLDVSAALAAGAERPR